MSNLGGVTHSLLLLAPLFFRSQLSSYFARSDMTIEPRAFQQELKFNRVGMCRRNKVFRELFKIMIVTVFQSLWPFP